MNILNGILSKIQSREGISLVKIQSNNAIFSSIVLDTPETASYLKINNSVKIIFKETEVIISKDINPNISIQNQLLCQIQTIKKGILLAEISLIFDESIIKSIITTNACEKLDLKENDSVLALIKTNEISLSPND